MHCIRLLLIALALLIMSGPASGQASVSTERLYEGPSDWYSVGSAYHPNGLLYHIIRQQSGFTEKTVILCTDTLGQVQWTRAWGNDNELIQPANIRVQPDGKLLVSATYYHPISGGSDLALLRMQPDGQLINQQTLKTSLYEGVRDIRIAANGNVFLLGEIESGNGYGSVVMEISPAGQILHQMILTAGLYTYLTHLDLAPDGHILLSGHVTDAGTTRSVLARIDPSWNFQWFSVGTIAGKQVRGYDLLPVLPNGNSRQLVHFDSDLWLIERDSGGQFQQEYWLGYGEPMGTASQDSLHCIATSNSELILIGNDSQVRSLQIRQTDNGDPDANPVILPNGSIATIGFLLQNNKFTINYQKGAAHYAPGCLGYYDEPGTGTSSGLSHTFLQPSLSTQNFNTASLSLAFGTPANPTVTDGCSFNCNGLPDAGFSATLNGLDLNFQANTPLADHTYSWTLGNGWATTGQQGSWTLPQAGAYMLCLKVQSPCGESMTCQTIQAGTTGTRETAPIRPLLVSPNPIAETCHISGLEPGVYHLAVYNLMGQAVARQYGYFEGSFSLNSANWAAGQYVLELKGERGCYRSMVVKH